MATGDQKARGHLHSSNSVSFEINGTPHTVYGHQYDVSMTLSRFIREVAGLTGTKVMCAEAGCGSCAVTVTMVKPGEHEVQTYTINSCLCPLYCIDGWQITTVEGLGNHREGFHPIQDRLAKFYGSQCGFCSPGIVMNMYGVLSNTSQPTEVQVEDAFGGNICRCTGYRPILDAMKSFAIDSTDEKYKPVDIEDVNKYLCPRTGESCTGADDGIHASDLELTINHGKQKWYRPASLDKLRELMSKYGDNRIKLLFGNTATGIFKEETPSDVYIDLHGVPELYLKSIGEMVNLGANHSIQDLFEIFTENSNLDGFGYFSHMASHINRIGSLPQRNAGSWAGNLMLKNVQNEFPSDIYIIFEAAGAQIEIMDVMNGLHRTIGLQEFLSVDMWNKVILSIKLYKHGPNDRFRSFKIMPRSQNAHAYVTAGFRFSMSPDEKGSIVSIPCIVYGGIDEFFNHAQETEQYLIGKNLLSPGVIETACSILLSELDPDDNPLLASANYRRDLAVNLLYKTLLGLLGDEDIAARYRSAALDIHRPVSHATREYQTKDDEFPAKQPMPKLTAPLQTSGEAQFINDKPVLPNELHAAFVLATVGNCFIDAVDPSDALKIPGVLRYIMAKDIPGENNFLPPPPPFNLGEQKLFSEGYIGFAGQAIGMILADNHETAVKAAKKVRISYKDHRPVVLTIEQAIENESIHRRFNHLVANDPEGTMSTAPHKLTGQVSSGDQAHFYLENQITLCVPNEDCINVYPSTQMPATCQAVAARINCMPINSINVEVLRIGGAFGGKLITAAMVSCAAALGTHLTGRPVRLSLNLADNMEISGKRGAFLVKYEVGFDDEGRVICVMADIYIDSGFKTPYDDLAPEIAKHFEQGYYIPNVRFCMYSMKTHKPSTEPWRGPGPHPAALIMETILEHVAKSLNKDPLLVKELNLYSEGQKTPLGHELTYCSARRLWQELKVWAEVDKRQQEIKDFNKSNTWRKRGIAMTATKYGIGMSGNPFQAFVAIFDKDGTVAVSVGGIEMGQGLFTKVAQSAAAALGVPIDIIKLKATNCMIGANAGSSGGSVTSELNVKAVVEACRELRERIDPVKAKNPGLDWSDLIKLCRKQNIELTAKHTACTEKPSDHPFDYYTYCAGVTEIEVDVLTGESIIRRVDILFDCGESLNPEIDIGQIEGGFVMGLGSWLHEALIYDERTGRLLNNGTWEYNPPTAKDIPIDWRIKLLSDAPNPVGILRSKASGEPPLCLSCGAVFALKHAIQDFREEHLEDSDYFELGRMPLTVEKTQLLCKLPINKLCLPDNA